MRVSIIVFKSAALRPHFLGVYLTLNVGQGLTMAEQNRSHFRAICPANLVRSRTDMLRMVSDTGVCGSFDFPVDQLAVRNKVEARGLNQRSMLIFQFDRRILGVSSSLDSKRSVLLVGYSSRLTKIELLEILSRFRKAASEICGFQSKVILALNPCEYWSLGLVLLFCLDLKLLHVVLVLIIRSKGFLSVASLGQNIWVKRFSPSQIGQIFLRGEFELADKIILRVVCSLIIAAWLKRIYTVTSFAQPSLLRNKSINGDFFIPRLLCQSLGLIDLTIILILVIELDKHVLLVGDAFASELGVLQLEIVDLQQLWIHSAIGEL